MARNKELEDLNRQIKENPDNIDLYCMRADLFVANKNYKSAIKDCKRIISISPNSVVGYYGLGEIYKQIGRYKKSVELFSKVIELDPENIYFYGTRANIKYIMKNFSGAIDDVSKAIELDTSFSQIDVLLANRATYYEAIQDYKSALSDYQNVFDLYSHNQGILYKIENCRMHLRNGWTKEDYLKQVEIEPNDYFNYLALMNFSQEAGEYKQAEEYLSKCIELIQGQFSFLPPTYLWGVRADLRAKLGDFEGAIEDYKKQIEPDMSDKAAACCYCKLADVYYKQNQLNKAVDTYETAITHYKDCAKLFKKTAELYKELKNFEKADEYFKKAKVTDKRNGKIHGSGEILNKIFKFVKFYNKF